jgi:hypothetical protein
LGPGVGGGGVVVSLRGGGGAATDSFVVSVGLPGATAICGSRVVVRGGLVGETEVEPSLLRESRSSTCGP